MGRPKKTPSANAQPGKKKQLSMVQTGSLPLIQKPAELVGKEFKVPGSHWGASAARGEANTDFICIVNDFSLLHTFSPTERGPAMQIVEVGETGSSGNSEPFWMKYPFPFLEFWYKSHPDLLTRARATHPEQGEKADGETAGGEEAAEREVSENKVYDYLDPVRSYKVLSGKQKGRMCHIFTCNIVVSDGGAKCGSKVTIYGKSIGAFFKHVRRRAAKDEGHREISKLLNLRSSRQVQLADGSFTTVFTFKESFPHHVDFVWLVASGLPMRLNRNPTMLDYVRGFEPRAVMPHNETIHRIVNCIDEVQRTAQHAARQEHIRAHKSRPCIGLQLDMWTDRNSGIAYVCVNDTWVKESATGLSMVNEVLDFHVFPFTAHTGANISTWLLALLNTHEIPFEAISGVTPDGAADGQAGCKGIPALKDKTDVCHLHDLMRVVLYGIGLAGPKNRCPNSDARDLIKVNKRFVQLANQSREVSDGLRQQQANAGIPLHKYISPVRTNATRWLNKAKQVSRNNVMRPIIDTVLSNFRRENANDTAILVRDSSDDDSEGEIPRGPYAAATKSIARRDIAFTTQHWDANLEMEGLLQPACDVKDTVEHTWWLNGAQSTFLMHRLTKMCNPENALEIKLFPKTARLADRKREAAQVTAANVLPFVTKGRAEMIKQIEQRFRGDRRPSEARLVQLHMSLQLARTAKKLPAAWSEQGHAFYVRWLRKILDASSVARRSSPHQVGSTPNKKKAKASSTVFFGDDDSDEEPAVVTESDPVKEEIRAWEDIPRERLKSFTNASGLVNEFEFAFSVRQEFPLHYQLFIEVMSHIPIEANSEDTFSLSGKLSNPNSKTSTSFLSSLVRVQANKKVCKPAWEKIYRAYEDAWGSTTLGDDVVDLAASDDSSSAISDGSDVDEA